MKKKKFILFGVKIRSIRRQNNIPIKDICNHMNWSKSYLMDIETGRSAPPQREKIEMLCDILCFNNRRLLFIIALQYKKKITLKITTTDQFDNALILEKYWGAPDFQEDLLMFLNEKATDKH